ncbi:MAG: hypothetical protein JW863_01120 [Chitinispirillaceae bacterium]|nr:hypothetical protein [Chitinispirillaceae bacterium]
MSKKEDLKRQLLPIRSDQTVLETFIIRNSNLPGPRGNLELAFAVAEVYDDARVIMEWTEITENQADVNDPRAFLPFCGAMCLGRLYTAAKNRKYITRLKRLAGDGRWRMREAVAFGFQIIGEHDFSILRTIFSEWITTADNLEQRAILVALAHPPILDEAAVSFCFEIADQILHRMDTTVNFSILKKGLEFTISVFAAADPEAGFRFIRKWIGVNRIIDGILEKNLTKKRLSGKYPEKTNDLLRIF